MICSAKDSTVAVESTVTPVHTGVVYQCMWGGGVSCGVEVEGGLRVHGVGGGSPLKTGGVKGHAAALTTLQLLAMFL